ncbi:glutathione synthetase-like [Odontomachus brunneus]|uniref:glutathione synthetase-like n=1 Tax=Odontomachus brunneus TaxID=486640 RepID=UPI0013F19BD8|nr:glutathione synthetase-like [Odontomachus brunneus]
MYGDNQAMMKMPIALNLSRKEFDELVDKAKDWALMNGMCFRSKTNFNRDLLQFAPFTVLPSPFPRKEFHNACDIQIILNTFIHRVAHDYDFLKETLWETVKADDFTRNLFDIYETVHREGAAQKLSLAILRSDLMLDTSCPKKDVEKLKLYCCWKQVEINTIASGFGWMGSVSTQLHRFILQELGYTDELKNLPENNALETLCSGMIEAWSLYGDPKSVILFVVEDVTYNICDQRFHEFEIRRQNPKVRVIRRNLTQLAATARLGADMELIVDDYVVSVVYYRSGYEPGQYHTRKEWDARLLIERSLAIKCPSIQYHLAGTKKVQQTLAKPSVIAHFLKDEKTAAKVKEIFTGLYPLDFDEQGNAAVEMGISEPQRFVLKPQREGGCNNIYGTDIRDFLQSVKSKQARVAWILMDRLHPPVHKNYVVKPGKSAEYETKELTSELGIFGVVIGSDKEIIVNKQGGYMLRTKSVTDNEGGVASGLGVCDTLPDVIHAVAKYEVGHEPREIFFFREGSIVMWNISDLECGNLLQFLRQYEHNRYTEELIHTESELMTYTYVDFGRKSHLKDGDIILTRETGNLDKYTFSNAMAQSVKLGIWEVSLNHYIDSIEFVTEDLKAGRKLRMTQSEVLRKQGELFNLRHRINLSSDLLDTPDFYWERDDLEGLYQQICGYFSITKRTRVMNERLNHCVELVSILSSHLSDRHHVRLEWMIIILIMVEVAFEILHYIDRYLVK